MCFIFHLSIKVFEKLQLTLLYNNERGSVKMANINRQNALFKSNKQRQLGKGLDASQITIVRNNTINIASSDIVPFFSVRKLRVIYNELQGNNEFKFNSFEAFKQDVLSSIAPQLELNRWESIASRR